MKKMNRKGFTIVELVIVIAVIAILAGVLIPTFSGIVKKAQDSALQQEAAALYKQAYALDLSDGKMDGMEKDVAITNVEENDVKYAISGGKATFAFSKNDKIAKFDGAKWTIEEHSHTWGAKADGVRTCTVCNTSHTCDTSGEGGKCKVCGE